jgi:hypothetical protein
MPQQVRRRTAPIHPRRVSGPARPRPRPRLAPAAAGVALPPRTGVFERIRALPDKRVVDRLLRGRLCIWVIGVMLGGIVAMQVSLLRLNAGISRAVITASTLERQNSDMEASIAKLTAGDRVRAAAAADEMIDPPAGEAQWLTAHPASDATRAVERMKPPSTAAIDIMNNGGRVPGALAQTPVTTPLAGAAGTAPVTTPVPTPTPAPTVVQSTATPVPTVAPVQTAVPGTGASTAPQG